MHQFRNHRFLRKSFQAKDATIEIEEDYRIHKCFRIIERGSGYVRLLVLYEEELRWLSQLCQNQLRINGDNHQIGCFRGGGRTLVCIITREGFCRRLEVRLFAPYGKRQVRIPELSSGSGWSFFSRFLSTFSTKFSTFKPKTQVYFGQPTVSLDGAVRDSLNSKSYLQAVRLPNWEFSSLRCALVEGKEKFITVNQVDAAERKLQMFRCLVGSLGGLEYGKDDLESIRRWMERKWKIPGGVKMKEIDSLTFLLIFPSKELVEEKIGKHNVMGETLLLDKWHSWGCCSRSGWSPNSIWIRVIGLPFFLWDKETFKSIGDYCGGFLETADETTTQSHLKWAKIRIKGNGMDVPASVKIKAGSIFYDCPIWVDRRPWVDWSSNSIIFDADRRPSRLGKMVVREVEAFQEDVHAPRRRRGREVNGLRLSKKGINDNQENGKFKWIKVGDKATQKSVSHISNSTNELPLLNRFELNDPVYNSMELEPTQGNEFNVAVGKELWDDQSNKDINLGENRQERIINEVDEENVEVAGNLAIQQKPMNYYGNHYTRSKHNVDHKPSSSQPRNIFNEFSAAYSGESPFETFSDGEVFSPFTKGMIAPYEGRSEASEANDDHMVCQPLAVIGPEEEWCRNEEYLMLQSCGQDQLKISAWVTNKMKSFKRILGFSCEGYEDKLMELLQSIEDKRRNLYED